MGHLIYIYPQICYKLFNDENSNFRRYLEKIFTMKERKSLLGNEAPFKKVEHYIEKIIYNEESKDLFFDIIFFLQDDEKYKEGMFSSFMTHYFSGYWWNLPYEDKCVIEFLDRIKKSSSHKKLLEEIFQTFLSRERKMVFVMPLEYNLGYEASNSYSDHTKIVQEYFYNTVLKETVNFELIDHFFSGNAKCCYSLFDPICELLNTHIFNKFELGRIEHRLVYFLCDIRKFRRKCNEDVLSNIEKMLKIIRSKDNYNPLVRFLLDDNYRNDIENPPIETNNYTFLDNETYYREEVRNVVKKMNWPEELYILIDELGISNFENYRLLKYSFVNKKIDKQSFIEHFISFKYRNNYLIMYYVISDFRTLGFELLFQEMYDMLDSTSLSNREKGHILRTAIIDNNLFLSKNFDNEIVEYALINIYAKEDQLLELYNFAISNKLNLAAISLAQRIALGSEKVEIPSLFELLNSSIERLNNDESNIISSVNVIYDYMKGNENYSNNISQMMLLEYQYYNILGKTFFIENYSINDCTFLINICKNFYRDDSGNMIEGGDSKYFFIYNLIHKVNLKFESSKDLLNWCTNTLQIATSQNYKSMGLMILATIMAKVYATYEDLFFETMDTKFFNIIGDKFYSLLSTNIHNIQSGGVYTIEKSNPASHEIEAINKYTMDLEKSNLTSNTQLVKLFDAAIKNNINWKNMEEARTRTTLGY